ncbi:MAG: hypothetical protein B6I28_02245 [Fusobacteriia bacterium 4572_132]|nr:MAG: hypothetical protein B6I28_02245 [Fusobacteriia bacterium 4572_132]
MKIIDKYIYKEMFLPIIFGISLFTFIFLIDLLVEMMENILVKNIPPMDVLEMISYYFPPILIQTIPMGLLLGVMITYGNLSSTSELVALESIGIGIKRFLKPAFITGILVTGFIYFLEEMIVPDSYEKLSLITKKIAYKKPALKIEEKVFIEDIGEYNIYINKMDQENDVAKNLIVFKMEKDTQYPQIIMAKKAEWENSNMILSDAKFYKMDSKGEEKLRGSFDKQLIPINTFFGGFSKNKNKSKSMMGISELKNKLKILDKNKEEKISYEIEYYQKLATPLSAAILSFLGVMLSVKNNRSGKGVSFGISLVIIFLYMMGMNFGKMLAKKEILYPAIAMGYPNVLLIIISLILFIGQIRRR